MQQSLPLCGSGLIGGFCAVIADISIKGESGAITRVAQSSRAVLKLFVPEYLFAIMFLILAAVLCLILKPKTNGDAFKIGIGVIATVMMGVPPAAPPNAPSGVKNTVAVSVNVSSIWSPTTAQAAEESKGDTEARPAQKGKVLLDVVAPSTSKGFKQLTITLKAARTEEMLARNKYFFAGDRSQPEVQHAQIEFEYPPGDYLLFVEAPGFVIDIKPLSVPPSERREVKVQLEPTWVPVFLQRIWR